MDLSGDRQKVKPGLRRAGHCASCPFGRRGWVAAERQLALRFDILLTDGSLQRQNVKARRCCPPAPTELLIGHRAILRSPTAAASIPRHCVQLAGRQRCPRSADGVAGCSMAARGSRWRSAPARGSDPPPPWPRRGSLTIATRAGGPRSRTAAHRPLPSAAGALQPARGPIAIGINPRRTTSLPDVRPGSGRPISDPTVAGPQVDKGGPAPDRRARLGTPARTGPSSLVGPSVEVVHPRLRGDGHREERWLPASSGNNSPSTTSPAI